MTAPSRDGVPIGLTGRHRLLYGKIEDALRFILKPEAVEERVVIESSLAAFGVVLKYKREKQREIDAEKHAAGPADPQGV